MIYHYNPQLTKCKNHKRYKGVRPPKCNGGDPCDMCMNKFKSACLHPVEQVVGGKCGQSLGKVEMVLNTVLAMRSKISSLREEILTMKGVK